MTQPAGVPHLHQLSQLLARRSLTWLFAGDSITQGVEHTHGQRCWTEHVHERVRYQLGRHLDVLINTGVAGWTAPEVLGEYDLLVGRFNADIVSIALGMNDCLDGQPGRERFRDSLGELVRRSSAAGALLVLHTPNTIAPGAWNDPAEVAAYAEIVRGLASESGAILVDHHAYWQQAFHGAPPREWLDEAVHPNAEGHRQLTALTLRTLGLGVLGEFA